MSHDSTLDALKEHLLRVNDILNREMKSSRLYSNKDLEILGEYLRLYESDDVAMQLAAAQLAVEELSTKTNRRLQLTQFGVQEVGTSAESINIDTAVLLNKSFLQLWDKERQKLKTPNGISSAARVKMMETLNRAEGLLQLPASIISMLEKSGFAVQSNSADSATVEEVVTHGAVIIATNHAGHEVEVRILPDGQFYIHAQVDNDLPACKKLETEMTNELRSLVTERSTAVGVPIHLGVARSGVGRNLESNKKQSEHQEESSANNPLTARE